MTHKFIFIIYSFFLLSLPTVSCAQEVGKNDYFYILNTQVGLSDNHILQMIQLEDGRMAVETFKGINIYDGKKFRFIPLSNAEAQTLSKYKGHPHLYVDRQERLWLKNTHQIFCIDLKTCQLIKHPLTLLAKHNQVHHIDDLFVDSDKDVWIVVGQKMQNVFNGTFLDMKAAWGGVQDMDVDAHKVYTFHDTGIVAAFDKKGTSPILPLSYTSQAYAPSQVPLYRSTSLVRKTPNGQFYQIRTGYDSQKQKDTSIFLHFNPETHQYETIYQCLYILHTLNMSSDNQALISSQRGYLMFDFKLGTTPREVRELALPDGKSLTTGINTVYKDQDGGIWLGTYSDGLIYVSPMLGLFFTIDHPWWQSSTAVIILAILILLVVCSLLFLYKRKRKVVGAYESVSQQTDATEHHEEQEEENTENEFITKARTLVEQHIEDSDYGVEQLANDLCMERTGLYKKLTALSATTPVTFIRNIRLQKATVLLREEDISVNEIAEKTGFNSASYFSKCFKKEFGILPSEYRFQQK